jgi:hypothetical protein
VSQLQSCDRSCSCEGVRTATSCKLVSKHAQVTALHLAAGTYIDTWQGLLWNSVHSATVEVPSLELELLPVSLQLPAAAVVLCN